jgi:hypothetical protein
MADPFCASHVYGRLERMKDVLEIGWDVGGWVGKKQAVAVARWTDGRLDWLGRAACFKLATLRPDWGLGDLVQQTWSDAPKDVLARHRIVLAIDAPLGFPTAFADLLAGRATPASPRTAWRPLAYRDRPPHLRALHEEARLPERPA